MLQAPQQNSMPPPTTPASQKQTDPSDLADALTAAGVDLKAEEAQMSAFVPPNVPQSQQEQYANALRRQAEIRANHMNDPFLHPRRLNDVLHKKTLAEGLPAFNLHNVNGEIQFHGAQADIAALLSLAARERMRDLITRGATMAKARRRPQGVITGEWATMIEGETPEMRPADSTNSSFHAGSKRSFDGAAGPGSVPEMVPTTNLTNPIAIALRGIKKEEWTKDKEFKVKRSRRESVNGGTPTPGTPGGPGDGGSASGTATPTGSTAPDPDRKMTMKEARKHQTSKLEEQISHRAANQTAQMMMGGFGGKKKKTYAWMNAGSAAAGGGSTTPRMGPQANPGSVGASSVPTGASEADQLNWIGQRMGVWREDGERGRNVQIRDWVVALEADGRVGKKGIQAAWLKMK